MTGHNSHHYCYDVSYQCWFASEEAKIYCYNFNRSNAVVCSHLILAYTVRLALINEAGLERNGWFFFFIEECCVVIEKNIDKKLANRISYQIWHKRCLRGNFSRGSKSAGGPIPLWHRDNKLFEVLPANQRNPRLQVNFVWFRSFWPQYGKKYNSYWYVLNIRTL